MCSLCRLPVAKNHIFGHMLTFWGLLYRLTFSNEGQIWCATAEARSTLTGHIPSEFVHCVGFRWPNATTWGTFWHSWGLLYRPPFTNEGQIWCAIADPRSTFTCEISSRSVYCVDLWRRKTKIVAIFCRFWTSAFSDVANWHQPQKVEHWCTTTNLPLSNGIKIVCTPTPSWRNRYRAHIL